VCGSTRSGGLRALLLAVPSLPHASVPLGSAKRNVEFANGALLAVAVSRRRSTSK
jgi:hypothetical protein